MMKSEPKPSPALVPASHEPPELTLFSVACGVVLALVFACANVYLALRVGMTVSASIPCAVVSMAVLRGALKRQSILENNIVQTISSAGESVAAGTVFTIPALFLWHSEWGLGLPDYLPIALMAFGGGVLGIMFMIPLRRAVVVKESGALPFPEGTACAKILEAGEKSGGGAKAMIVGFLAGAVYKLVADGLRLFASQADWALARFKGVGLGVEVLPALLGVGYIVGVRISAFMLLGGALGWLVAMPIIYHFGSQIPLAVYPSPLPIAELDAWGLWRYYVRYLGAGMVAFCGILYLLRSGPMIFALFRGRDRSKASGAGASAPRTDRDLPPGAIFSILLATLLLLAMLPIFPVGLGGTAIIAFFGFFFAALTSRIVGLVGSSNNPASGLIIVSLLVTGLLFKLSGQSGRPAMISIISVGTVLCVLTAIVGDTSQDLKTGQLLGATPSKQQIGELIGVAVSSMAVGAILILMDRAWGFGSAELPAPQATMMKLIVEGVMGGDFPKPMILAGAALGLIFTVLRLPALPVAIGLYLPIHLGTAMIFGGLAKLALDRQAGRKAADEAELEARRDRGLLFSSGLIAGEGVVGILLAIAAVAGLRLSLAPGDAPLTGNAGACVAFGLLLLWFARVVFAKDKKAPRSLEAEKEHQAG
jgi:putative OPT family oligopeptide transporter